MYYVCLPLKINQTKRYEFRLFEPVACTTGSKYIYQGEVTALVLDT